MTVNEAIMAADELRPNSFDENVKTRWLSELDGKISLEIHKADKAVKYECSADENTTLLVPEPHSSMYPLYLVAMIDFYNKDTESYENTLLMFNSEYDIFAKRYQRNNMPPDPGGFKNFL